MGVRAAILTAPGAPLVIEEIELLPLGPCDVRVRVTATALCHTDVTVRAGDFDYGIPIVMGHEAAGVVEEIGRSVTMVKVGDAVISSSAPACATCVNCTRGKPHLCILSASVRSVPRARRADGGVATALFGLGSFAEQMVVHQASLVAIESDLPQSSLALIGCGVTTGLSAMLNRGGIPVGGSAVVIGCGTVGLAAVAGAAIAGASTIVAIDPKPARHADALHHGATLCCDSADDRLADKVMAETAGAGADVVLDAVGSPRTVALAGTLARRGGEILVVGMPGRDAVYTLPAFPFFLSEQRLSSALFGSADIRRDFPAFVRLAEKGRLDLGYFVSRTMTLDEVNEGLDALARGEILRAVVIPHGKPPDH